MNRINTLFEKKNKNILSIYYTAGYPAIDDTVSIARLLQEAGVDMLEIGFPYSDPVADGEVIQASSKQALENGMCLDTLFSQLRALREAVTIPVLLMGYFNPVLQYGVEKFCKTCAEVGVDGCIIPDLPLKEYETLYQDIFKKHNLSTVFLISPQTTPQRIEKIDALSDGFIYLLSSSATTGNTLQILEDTKAYFLRIAAMKLKNPTMIGFGIRNKETLEQAFTYANGAIIGSAFVKGLQAGALQQNVHNFIRNLKD